MSLDHEYVGQTVLIPVRIETADGERVPVKWAFGEVKEVFYDKDIPDEDGTKDLAQIVNLQGYYPDEEDRPDVVDPDEAFFPVELLRPGFFSIAPINVPPFSVN